MTEEQGSAIDGSLGSRDGKGIVVMKSRYATDPADLWSAITEPERLTRWYGKVEGDLQEGGEFTLFVHGSHWEGRGRINVCDPPRKLQVTMAEEGRSEGVLTAELIPDGTHTALVIERSNVPLDKLVAHGAGWHLHVEDLAAYLAVRETRDWGTAWLDRWDQLEVEYRDTPIVPRRA
jgi:uncharacterized protein YndB with AHSA1/START domain